MQFIRGFKGEGHVLGRQEASTTKESSSLLVSGACSNESDHSNGESDGDTRQETQVDNRYEVTDSESGKMICLALKLPEKVIKRQFLTTDKTKVHLVFTLVIETWGALADNRSFHFCEKALVFIIKHYCYSRHLRIL